MHTHSPYAYKYICKEPEEWAWAGIEKNRVLLDFFRTDLYLSAASSLSAPPVFGSLVHLVTLLKVRKQMTSLSLPPIYICLDGHTAQGNT